MGFHIPSNSSVNTDTPINATIAAAGTALDLVLVPVGQTGRIFSIVNRGPGDAAYAFDRVATVNDTLIKSGEVYSESGLEIKTKVSFINVTAGKKPQITGILWSA